MLTKRNALLAAGAAVLVAVAGARAASASDWNWYSDSDGFVPNDAVSGGDDSDGVLLSFCRVWDSVGYQPGKVSETLGTCNYPYGGQERKSAQYEVLVPHWEWTSGGRLTGNPYAAGFDTDGAELYVCRAQYRGGLQPGKLKQGAGCYIGYGGNEILLNNYAVLQDDLPMFNYKTNPLDRRVITGGQDSPAARALFLCVANYNGSLQPGKWIGDDGMCHFSYAGNEVLTNDFSFVILRTTNLFFRIQSFDFVAGQDRKGQPLYACTTPVYGLDGGKSIRLGKYRRDFDDGCHVSWGGYEWGGTLVNAPGTTPAEALVD
jgi:hypothetical protein